ncbi:hypothetical protein AZE42_11825 [Rhizopogon vesiculosus]|uniref:Uncharacterized protein n=1 Tax=Rhizopogon vesiculosus TaxID=180088 RepID=A0A1J8PES2_9AGAM|nr:hypothetical protein AZE42_11825 [Rhizopogon vesiculosus]
MPLAHDSQSPVNLITSLVLPGAIVL